jgi:hypothetical protein
MKAKEVPQDDANMLQGKLKEPVYSVDENGNYTTVPSVGWDPKNAVMKQAWDAVYEKTEAVRLKVLSGDLSPIAYYMEKKVMDASLLSKYIGLWKWTVKKHLKQKHFVKLPDKLLQKYADIFDLTLEEIKDIDKIKNERMQG